MAESNTYTGAVAAGTPPTATFNRTTYQVITSEAKISAKIQWAAFNNTPFLKAVGLEAFGVPAMQDLQKFGQAKTSGRLLKTDSGVYAFKGQIFTDTGTSFHVGRLGTFNPELVEGGTEWAYSWHRLVNVQFIPDVDVQDNAKGLISIKAHKMEAMEQSYVRDFNYVVLGDTTNAPADNSTIGPASVNHDLPNLISVTQTRTIGGIATTNSFWQNGAKAVTSIGGGGEMDRPLLLRRALMDQLNDQSVFAEGTMDYLLLGTQGAWQYYDRLMYADSVQGRNGGAFGTVEKYDAAGIPNYAFSYQPFIWDPTVQVPFGATASTESIYGIHIPSFGICMRSEENFLVSGWETPREHDLQKTLVTSIKSRYTPAVTARRCHFVLYEMPANTD